ncbi:hypothetical protein HNR46_002167 [Haloferula luteola]|uniref:FecR protein n=1 Tax=Haloferula luteola TaxID=595692 RepID=A0A840VB69_9BACT|nr:hypothetical protein [Haloferula luteola]MBB5351928.1 hypothetical protein [Haloferula luteola]
MSDEELEILIHELLDGTIDRENFAHLKAALLASPEARQLYYDLTCTDQLLVERFSAPKPAAHRRWSEKRSQGHPWALSLAAAAIILLLLFGTMMLTKIPPPDVHLTASADARFTIDGQPTTEFTLHPDQRLSVKSGMIAARINSATELFLESPAEIVLLDPEGTFELISGRGWVDIKSSAPDFKAVVAGASIRHLGTRYGIVSGPGGTGEVHVAQGKVDVRLGESTPTVLVDGEAAHWTRKGPVEPLQASIASFQQALPSETTLFSDDFNEAEGTPLSGKRPDVGSPWMVLREKIPTYIGDGTLDTSGGYRRLSAPFRRQPTANGKQVFLITLSTTQPQRISDKESRLGGSESIRVWDDRGTALFSLVALAKESHQWRLQDGDAGSVSDLLDLSALAPHQLTLCFDPSSKSLTLHEGASPQGRRLARLDTTRGVSPVSLTVENDDGGDLALTRIFARSVSYPVPSEVSPDD